MGTPRKLQLDAQLPFREANPRVLECPAGKHHWVAYGEGVICGYQACQLVGPSFIEAFSAFARGQMEEVPAGSEAARFDAIVRMLTPAGNELVGLEEMLTASGWELVKHGQVRESKIIVEYGIPDSLPPALKAAMHKALESV